MSSVDVPSASDEPLADAAEAPASTSRPLSGEKAQRIVDAMRSSVARRGTAGSTFDHVAREAGVSRGLLHYYFGTKEQLLVEAVRRDTELRLEMLEERLSTARTATDFVALMAQDLQQGLAEDPDFYTLIFELFTLGRRHPDIAVEYAGLMRRTREQVAGILQAAEAAGIVHLSASPEAVTEVLFSVADGFALRILSEPDRDFTESMEAAIACARALVTD
jgi:AcrR family transcriptional regulator